MNVEYFSIEGAPGEYFMCSAYRASISVKACADMYRAEKGVHVGAHMHCAGCPIGARHAGQKPIAAPGLFGSTTCPRCQRGANRLVRGLCVSCLNRQYEYVKGRNAKGRPPIRATPLALSRITVVAESTFTAEAELSSGWIETALRVLRTTPDAVAISRKASFAPILAAISGQLFEPRRVTV